MKCSRTALVGGLVLTWTSSAFGSVIDITQDPNEFDQFTWGWANTVIYAQSVIADDVLFSLIEMRATWATGGDILFNVIITGFRVGGAGLGFEPDMTDIRYNSGMQTVAAGAGQVLTSVNPNLPVTPGERLFVVFDTFSYPSSGNGSMRATQFNGPNDWYTPGEFVFVNTSGEQSLADFNNASWGHRFANNEDLALLMEFKIPAPATAALLGLAGLAGGRRRRRRA